MPFQIADINPNWTLFLDRDGVINVEKNEDYIKHWEEFQFYEESLLAMPILASKFKTIVIATNQKGIGKGLMTHEDLNNIHHNMLEKIKHIGGRIDDIFYCPDLENDSPNRKPQPGMAYQAKAAFPKINFNESIMVGNRPSDMFFGKNAGMHTAYLNTTHPDTPNPHPAIDLRFDSLWAFAQAL